MVAMKRERRQREPTHVGAYYYGRGLVLRLWGWEELVNRAIRYRAMSYSGLVENSVTRLPWIGREVKGHETYRGKPLGNQDLREADI